MLEQSIETQNCHNPDNLSDEIIKPELGWRVLDNNELENIEALPKNDETVEEWNGDTWDLVSTLHLDTKRTYRTKRK